MILKDQNILFFTRTMKLGGTENVVLQLCEIFKPLVNKIVVCSCGGVNVEKLNNLGIKHYEIPDIESKSISTITTTIKTLLKIVKEEKITIIHTHHRMAAFYVTLLGLYKKCKFINTSHNTFTDKVKLTQFVYKNANLVACGQMVKNNLTSVYGLPDKQVTVIHNAVKPFDGNFNEDELIKELHNNNCFVIGNIGRLSEQKGMEYYIQSIPKVIANIPNARFLIVGTGEDEVKLKELVNNINVNEYVYFLGYRNDIQNIMSQLDLVVLSSLWEGLPLTPIEAFSVSKTIVATAVDGTVEIVKDKENGLLVDARNSEQIADAIIDLANDKEKIRKFENNAYKTFVEEFSFDTLANNYIEYYKNIK